MSPIRPMLDDLELQQVQQIEVDGDQVLAQHSIPALEGDFFQRLGRRAAQVTLAGVLTGPEVGDNLESLRQKFRAAAPVSFTADIATATRIDQVLIEEMGVRELAGKPARFEYAFTLREYIPATEPRRTTPLPPIDPIDPIDPQVETGILEVEVIAEGQPEFDFDQVTVTVEGNQSDGTFLNRTLTNRTADNIWTENDFPPGSYTATATAPTPPMTGSASGSVLAGQTTRLTIILRAGQTIAKMFMIHYWFDRAFVEPCLRKVMRQVADYAAAHPAEKLLIVGHTDESGNPDYNQSLSERRARGAFAYLTFGRDANTAVDEWNELRRARTVGNTTSTRDTWGPRQYQQMLQELGFYKGPISDTHTPDTASAVRQFQTDNGLAADGIVGDDTWPVLIRAYLNLDPLGIPESQFLPNAKDGCDGGILKWLGCGEKSPAASMLAQCAEPAWRPNRRTEFLFVRASKLPCAVAQPVTFNLPAPGAVSPSWCLGPGDPNNRCCFATRDPNQQDKWLIQPAEPQQITVAGSIKFEDGAPLANAHIVLIAPDGEFMDGEQICTPQKGLPIEGRTNANGEFSYPNQKGVGIFILEIREDVVARIKGAPLTEAKGPVVCRRLDGQPDAHGNVNFEVIVASLAAVNTQPSITTASNVVVVKKSYTNPVRQTVTLRVNNAFTGSGLFTRSSDAIRFFDAAVGGNELTFNGTDNVFSDAQLVAGLTLFAEGARASAALDDVQLQLILTVNGQPGLGATANMTAVELTLDVALSRTAPGVEPPVLSTNDKINTGRFVQVRDASNSHERAMLIVRQAQPAAFAGELILTPINARIEAFTQETPAAGQVALPNPQVIANGTIPANGARFFAQGVNPSAAVRDSGFQLGIRNVEADGDRVLMTTVQIDMAETAAVGAPAITFTRFGLWDQAYDAAGNLNNNAAEANNFVGADRRRFHLRVRDASVTTGSLSINWKTLRSNRTDLDAPASQLLTLPETGAGARLFISRGVMLVTDDTDAAQSTHSGLAAPLPDAGVQRARGQSNHRLRKAALDGFVQVTYAPTAQPGVRMTLTHSVFNRNPEDLRRLTVRVIRYTNAAFVAATAAYIAAQFQHANDRWNQIGLQIDAQATVDRPIPAAALTGTTYAGSQDNANEQAALGDLIPITPDNTLTAVFVPLSGANAYATIAQRSTVALGNRYFIFIDENLDLNDETLAHELAHVLFNRFDTATGRQFYTLNTNSPNALIAGTGIALPDVRIYRRIQNRNSPDPNNDAANNNVVNWARRTRTARFPIAPGFDPATATTGNTLIQNF
ncbi:MAG: peptidoglycan-binding protein [Caldilineaceae bacterium]